jgi:hypothetical protein
MLKLDRTDTPAGSEHATVYPVFELSKKTWRVVIPGRSAGPNYDVQLHIGESRDSPDAQLRI